MSADSVDQVFEKAISTIHTLSSLKGYNSLPRPPVAIRTELYALFKQSTEGDVERVLPRPKDDPNVPENSVAIRKWDAWRTKAGLSKTQAKKEYIQMLISTMKSYAMGTLAARELLADLEFLWMQVAHENSDDSDESGGMIFAIQDELQDSKSIRLRREIYETLFTLNESKTLLPKKDAPDRKRAGENSSSRISQLRRIVIWIVSFLCRKALAIAKAVLFQASIMVALLVTAKQLGLVSPLSIDLTHTHAKPFESQGRPSSRFVSFVCGGLASAFGYLNRITHLNIHRLYINVG